LGYNAVPPPYIGNFMPPKLDLSFSGLEEFTSEPIVFESEEEDVPQAKIEKKIVKPSFAKIEFVKPKGKTARKIAKQVEKLRQNTHTPRGNQRNWNNMMSQRLGSNFEMFNKACFVCGSFDHLQRVNTIKDKNVNTVNSKAVVNAARPKAVVNVVKGNNVNVVKASACWVWKPKTKVLYHVSKHNSASITLKKFDYVDAQGNMSYLTNFEEIDRGYVAFGGNPKRGKITSKGTIKTVPRMNNMYSVDLKNVVAKGGLTYLFVKATSDESKLWYRRIRHINFKTMNKLVKRNLVRGLPSKVFEINQTCVACQKGKQHRASYKSKTISSISQPLHMLHMDLFGLTFVKSLMKKMYCLVVTDDYSRCDNGTEFKNKEMNQFCKRKCIKREFSVARTPQQNGVAERKNRTLIEAARTMLADSKLPTTFWAEAVNTACYVQNKVLVTNPHNKTPYELFLGRKLALGFMKPFMGPVTILNTIDHLGKFDGEADEGFFVGFCEEMRILLLKLVFTFPCKLKTPPRVPPNLDDWDTNLLQLFDFSIHDFYRFLYKMELIINMNSIQRNG
ncbi:putative ribonuclease H-like domain-containing protein, partial [Tanacetum coccineum]